MPFPYKIEVINEEMEIYAITNTKNHNYYQLTKREDGGFDHAPRCKALEVYSDNFLCRHKKIILGKYYAREEYRYLFNISPPRKKSISD